MNFSHRIILVGFGSIGRGVVPLLAKFFDLPKQLVIVDPSEAHEALAKELGVPYHRTALTRANYEAILTPLLQPGDFLLNLSVNVSSGDLIRLCQKKQCLYLDTCIEPWEGDYLDPQKSAAERTNYALRERILVLKKHYPAPSPTAVVTHGANPGLVSSLTKKALLQIAQDHLAASAEKTKGAPKKWASLTAATQCPPQNQTQWAQLSADLGIRSIHIAEYDWQTARSPKQPGEFVNTWSVDGFFSEGCQPAELGWGSHERHWPRLAHAHTQGCQAAIYLDQPGLKTALKSWTPLAGQYKAFLITHGEAISLADFLTLRPQEGGTLYRPTVHYSYRPCNDAILSLHELEGRDLVLQSQKRILCDEIEEGIDELGVLLLGHFRGAYWFGSRLSTPATRCLVPHSSATTLQVTAGVLAGLIWAIENPTRGIVEPEELDFERVLSIAAPYLGEVVGEYSDWNPLQSCKNLFLRERDTQDPWQFINFLI